MVPLGCCQSNEENDQGKASTGQQMENPMQPLDLPENQIQRVDVQGVQSVDEYSSIPRIKSTAVKPTKLIVELNEFMSIFLGIYTNGENSIDVAMKTFDRRRGSETEMRKFMKEASILNRFRHDHVISFYGLVEDGAKLSLVMECMEGRSIDKFLERKRSYGRTLSAQSAFTICTQICDGMAYVHQKSVVHFDLWMGNVLIEEDVIDEDRSHYTAKICDFGLSRYSPIEDPTELAEEPYTSDVVQFGRLVEQITNRVSSNDMNRDKRCVDELRSISQVCGAPSGPPTFAALVKRMIQFHRLVLQVEYRACGCARVTIKPLFGPDSVNILLIGSRGSGKSTIMRSIGLGEVESSSTDGGVPVERISYKNVTLIASDLDYKDKRLWDKNMKDPHGLLLIIDSSNHAEINSLKNEFDSLIRANELGHKPIVLLDLRKNEMKPLPLTALKSKYRTLTKGHIRIQSVDMRGMGLYRAFSWLVSEIRKK